MSAPNFTLVTELQTLIRRDFYVSDTTILDPTLAGNPGPLLDGEWLEFDANTYKLKRGSGDGIPAVYPVHTERGRYDTQAIGKVNVLMLGAFEAETKICSSTSVATGDALVVADVTIGGVTGKRGLIRAGNAGVGQNGEVIVGYCTKVVGTNHLRFVRCSPRLVYGNA